MSFGFDRIGPHLRRERLENEPHFLRFRSLMKTNSTQTISFSFMSSHPRMNTGMTLWAELWHGFDAHLTIYNSKNTDALEDT
ncbi:hypothetical protein CLV41_104260 [Roseibium marinum]|uniref:Uncharacterized protein n=1 Tax=Roseibium marinum TaxID=281252 RepID=A0A2S3UVU0_9HYPH|nr:hypothetical protein CLV41_104260 [Roseibium marinum]